MLVFFHLIINRIEFRLVLNRFGSVWFQGGVRKLKEGKEGGRRVRGKEGAKGGLGRVGKEGINKCYVGDNPQKKLRSQIRSCSANTGKENTEEGKYRGIEPH